MQGETTWKERFSGDSKRAYNWNLKRIGMYRGEGSCSQDGPAYDGVCAYMANDFNTPRQQHPGITVIDVSDPRHPHPTAYLDDTAAALSPHETLKVNERRHLLVVAEYGGPGFAVYDTSNPRYPKLLANIELPGSKAHMGAFAPDGRTYYLAQDYRGPGGEMYVVDLSDPSNPKQLPTVHFQDIGMPHGLQLNPEGFLPGWRGGTLLFSGQSADPEGLVILDVSDWEFRRPNPQIRIIGTLFFEQEGIVEDMYPVTINGHPYIVSTDEGGGAAGPGGFDAACKRESAAAFGYPQIIDVSDPKHPRIVAKLMLEVNEPANCSYLLRNTPPDFPGDVPGTNLPAESGTINYSNERVVPNYPAPQNATMLACSFQNAGLRVFDIRDPHHPKEIAYYKPPATRREVRPSSDSWAPAVDLTVDVIAGYVHWRKVRGEWELWTVSDNNGLQVLRFEHFFKAHHRSLFEGSGK